MRALFAPAAGAEIGGGHLMRGLALAAALEARGVASVFALPPWGEQVVHRFAGARPPQILRLDRSGDIGAIAAGVDTLRPDLLILDDYGLDGAQTASLSRPGLTMAVVDDLADRTYACDLLVDPGFGRAAADYAGLTPEACRVLAGPRYALLRPGFAAPPPERRGCDTPVRRVFVCFGLSDVETIAERAVRRLRPRAPEAVFDVALAADAPSLPGLQAMAARDGRLRLHPDARDIAGLMRAAYIAVGAGGSATWERCALGLPTLAVVVADNQRAMIGRLSEAGVALSVDLADPDFDTALASAFDVLQGSEVRRRLSLASRALCDGRGAARVAEAALERVQARLGRAGVATSARGDSPSPRPAAAATSSPEPDR